MAATPPAEPRVAVVGAGVMGAGIAQVVAGASAGVSLYDPDADALAGAVERIRAGVAMLGGDPDAVLGSIGLVSSLADAVEGADLVIEAGPELPALKQEIFAALEAHVREHTVLASNTSAIPIRSIAARLQRRDRVLGTHFWRPAQLVGLVEVVQSEETDPRCVEWTIAFLRRCGMRPVHVRADVPGFVGNRLQHALKREAIALVAEGVCDAETVDTVVKDGFGSRLGSIGPLEQADLGGLELTLQIHEVVMPALDNTAVPHPLLVEKVARGETGAAVGRGFRDWAPGEGEALRARVDADLLEVARRRAGRPAPAGAAPAPPPPGFRSELATVKDFSMHYLIGGEGPPVVVVHGAFESWWAWREVIGELARDRTVIVPALRGLAESGKPESGYDADNLADDLGALARDELGLERFALVGHDWGAVAAYCLAAQAPEAVERLAIYEMVMPGLGVIEEAMTPRPEGRFLWHLGFQSVPEIPELLIAGNLRAYMRALFDLHAAEPGAVDDGSLARYVELYSAPGALRALLAYYRNLWVHGEQVRAHCSDALAMPVLAYGGERSLGPSVLEGMARLASAVDGGVIGGCGHWVAAERPGFVVESLRAFLGS
jgi:3-hydroxybutyryl-CoA dehydrogenase